ncbi:MAG TPA: helix-turn-helix transcriptional regulator [Blastocatellia bacterium]|nr:helix-turn-helix transcriptional regulator [Blastocatellia bacterium]
MGRKQRERPEKLAEKLLTIRQALGFSQTQMWRALGLEEKSSYHIISYFENGKQEPSILDLLRYARLAHISLEILADDEQELPVRITKKKKVPRE